MNSGLDPVFREKDTTTFRPPEAPLTMPEQAIERKRRGWSFNSFFIPFFAWR